ncbi:Centromere/kinetochore protein zw10 [Nowakowskiella sp. JEL0078]|nr:Centromere/kinetochore protein zw10 [Nowakowskiella sp. JEL0078]
MGKPNEGKGSLTVSYRVLPIAGRSRYDSAVPLINILLALNELDLLDLTFAKFVDDLDSAILEKLWQGATFNFDVKKTKNSAIISWNWKIGVAKKENELFENLKTITEFLTSSLLHDVSELTPILLMNVWNHIHPHLTALLNKSTDQSANISETYNVLDELEIPHPELDVSKLRIISMDQQRKETLIVIRDLLVQEDWNTVLVTQDTERGGVGGKSTSKGKDGKGGPRHDKAVSLEACCVSNKVHTLVEMVYQVLTPTENLEEAQAESAFYTARDMLHLFRALIPVSLNSSMLDNPVAAMVFFNDCRYLEYHIITLSHYSSNGEVISGRTFIDMLPVFRKLGESRVLAVMRLQRDEIVEGLKGVVNSFQSGELEEVEESVKKQVVKLKILSKKLKVVMQTTVYLSVIATWTETLVTNVLNSVAEAKLDDENQWKLRYILGMVKSIEEEFEERVDNGKTFRRVPVVKVWDGWERLLDIWGNLQ